MLITLTKYDLFQTQKIFYDILISLASDQACICVYTPSLKIISFSDILAMNADLFFLLFSLYSLTLIHDIIYTLMVLNKSFNS